LFPEKTTFIPDTFLLRNSHPPLLLLHAWCPDENIGLEIFYAGGRFVSGDEEYTR